MALQLLVFILLLGSSLMRLESMSTTGRKIAGNKTDDQLALLEFKKLIDVDPSRVLRSWEEPIHFCNWEGITCGRRHRRVISLDLEGKGLGGKISPSIGNLTFLHFLNIGNNSFHGEIPEEIGNLKRLQYIHFTNNTLEGELPISLTNCSRLRGIYFSRNNLVGKIPAQLMSSLSKLEEISIFDNDLTGEIPASFANISSIRLISLGGNGLQGSIPESLSQLRNLYFLALGINKLSGMVPPSLYNLSSLETLSLDRNQLHGRLPGDIGFTLPNFKQLAIGSNLFSGSIPNSITNISTLELFDVDSNSFVGPLPNNFGNLQNLQIFIIHSNQFGAGEADGFDFLDSLINCTHLLRLELEYNGFKGPLPNFKANLSTQLSFLALGNNQIYGTIPAGIENLVNLTVLAMEHNFLDGNIPSSIGKLRKLQRLYLGGNRLSGQIPTKGIFRNASAILVNGNDKLCGGIAKLQLPACTNHGSTNRELSHTFRVVLATVSASVTFLLISSFLILYWIRKSKSKPPSTPLMGDRFLKISYKELFQATGGFSSTNLIGSGSFGFVYKGIINQDETIVAVKVLKLQNPRAYKSFMAECEALRNIRHRNLVKILTSCSSLDSEGKDFKALVYEFMPNGSLADWLHLPMEAHNHSRNLSLLQRLNIAIDVASALDYLHYHCYAPIVHCDLKPSNVLLDSDMTAHISDFGLARLLLEPEDNSSQTQTSTIGIKGSIGYAAPEYGMGGKATTQGDIFSYGILLLEMFTGKKPTDHMFIDELNLHNFGKAALPIHVIQILDPTLLTQEEHGEEIEEEANNIIEAPSRRTDKLKDCITSIIEIAVQCSMELPRERMNMSDVVRKLHLIKGSFLEARIYQNRATTLD